MLKKPQSTILGEALVAALDNRERAVQNLRNACSTSEEDASLNRDQMILDALTGYNTAEQAVHSRSMDTLALAPPAWGTIGTRAEVIDGPGAPGTEEPLPETPVPGEPTPTEGDPSVPRKDKIPPAQPVQPDPSGNTVTAGVTPPLGEQTVEQARQADGVSPRTPSGQVDVDTRRPVKDAPQA